MHGAWTRGLYFHFRSKIWRHHRLARSRFPLRREIFGHSAINERYIAHFSLRMHEPAVFPLPVWRHHRVPRPRFSIGRVNFGDSHTFKADILLLNICMGFQGILTKNGGFGGQNRGRGGAILTPQRTRSYFSGFLRPCQFWWKSIKKCDRESAHSRTDTHTHRQTQTDFIICPMLCYSYGTDNYSWTTFWVVDAHHSDGHQLLKK